MSERVVRYVCGQCGLDTHCTVPETTVHWSTCVAPKREAHG